MQNTERKLKLLSDIQKVIDAIDEKQEAFIATWQKDEMKKEIAQVIYRHKSKKLKELLKNYE